MARVLLTLFLLPVAAWPQFYDLATPNDGSIVYFVTRHRRAGTDEPFQGRIYAVDARGLHLYEQRERQIVSERFPILSNPYDLSRIEVSGAGDVVAFSGRRVCSGTTASQCLLSNVSTVRNLDSGVEREVFGSVRLSENGRYALVIPSRLTSDFQGVLDLATGKAVEFVGFAPDAVQPGRAVANDGSVVIPNGGVELWRFDGTRTRFPPGKASLHTTVIDAEAKIVVFSETERLGVFDIAGESERTLVEGRGEISDPVVTSDGRRVLFRSTLCLDAPCLPGLFHAYLIETDGSGLRSLGDEDTGVQRATLSGDGQVAYLVTDLGTLVRVEVESGEQTTLIARTPEFRLNPADRAAVRGARGSLSYFYGAGLSDEEASAQTVPLPTKLVGFQMRIAGVEVPLFSVRADVVAFQMPWSFWGSQSNQLVLPVEIQTAPGHSPFEPEPVLAATTDINLADVLALPADYPPAWQGRPFSLAAAGDFSRLLTPEQPASPGDVVHVYAIGLGAVGNEPETGHAAPVREPLARLEEDLVCTADTWDGASARTEELPVAYAGLAPGLVGVYQVSLRLPFDLGPHVEEPGLSRVFCRFRSRAGGVLALLPIQF